MQLHTTTHCCKTLYTPVSLSLATVPSLSSLLAIYMDGWKEEPDF